MLTNMLVSMWQLASALGLIRFLPFIAAQAPERDRAEHARVAQWVLDNLINVGSAERGFRALHGTFGESGSYERRVFDFKLLVELVSPEGEIYLRASDEAINVLVGALDTDVESAQIAAEVNQYAETLRRKLDATRRDVRAVDWEREVPDLIDHSRHRLRPAGPRRRPAAGVAVRPSGRVRGDRRRVRLGEDDRRSRRFV
jgi:hypothetical protein